MEGAVCIRRVANRVPELIIADRDTMPSIAPLTFPVVADDLDGIANTSMDACRSHSATEHT